MKLKLKVVPGSSRDSIAGWLDDALKIKVKAPPEAGKANAAVINLLAAELGVPAKNITIISGHGNPNKTVEILGLDSQQIDDRLARRTGAG